MTTAAGGFCLAGLDKRQMLGDRSSTTFFDEPESGAEVWPKIT